MTCPPRDQELDVIAARLREIGDALDIIAEKLKIRGSITSDDVQLIAKRRDRKPLVPLS